MMRYFVPANADRFGRHVCSDVQQDNHTYIWAVKSEKEAFALFDDGDINYHVTSDELTLAETFLKNGIWVETDKNGIPLKLVAAKPKRKRSRSKKKYYIHKVTGKFTALGDGKRYVFVINGEKCYALFGGNCRGKIIHNSKDYLPISNNWVETDRYGNPLDPQYNYLKDK